MVRCYGKNCPYKNNCKRYNYISVKSTTFFLNAPIRDGKCKYLVPDNKIQIRRHND